MPVAQCASRWMYPLLLAGLVLMPSGSALSASIDPALMTLPQQQSPAPGLEVPLSAVFDESLVNSPRAAHIRAQLGITKAAYAYAWTFPNPSFFFLEDTAQRARQTGAAIPLEHPWKLAFRLLLAKSQLKQTDFEIQGDLWQVRNTIRRAYLDVVMATETSDTLAESRRLSSELLLIAQKRFHAGDVAAFDVNRAQLASYQAEADLKQNEKRLLQATQRLSVVMGRTYSNTVQVQRLPKFQLKVERNELLPDFSKEFPSLDSLIQEALRSRMDLKAVQQSIVVNQANIRIARANILPNPQLNVGDSFSGNPPTGPATRGFFIGVTEEVPLLNRQQGDRTRLKAINIQLNRQLEARKNVITEEVVSAYQQQVAARERIAYFQDKILAASDTVVTMAKCGYEVGESDITSTLAAQQANVQAKAAYLDAVRLFQQSLTDLEQAIGHPI